MKNKILKYMPLVMLLPGIVTGSINSSIQPRLEIGEVLPSVALGLPQLGAGEALAEADPLLLVELSEADNISLGQAMSRARREIRRPTELQAELEQNRDTHFFASNPSQKLGVRFTSNGARIESKFKDRDWQADFHLESRPPMAEVAANGSRMEYSYGSIIEWYDNRSDGIEHGFILKERPADAGDDLVLKIALTGLKARLEQSGSGALDLVDSEGQTVLSYGKLKVWDAKGVELASWLTVQDDDIIIIVADVDAHYPVTIDPLITSQEAKLMASDGAADDDFGCSVSISGDSAIVGAYGDDENGSDSGSAYVFVCSNGVWTQEQKLMSDDGTVGDKFGYSVSLSGNIAIVGAPLDDDNGENSGSAYVFVCSSGIWTQKQKLTADDGAAEVYFGCSVSLSGDRAIVGAAYDDEKGIDSGSVYVFFSLKTGVWVQEQKLTASDGAAGDEFGLSVSISDDKAIVGADRDDDNGSESGSAYVFVRNSSSEVWEQERKLTASDGVAEDRFGGSVSLSGDRVIVGAHGDDDNGSFSGSAYVFVRKISIINTWTQEQKLMPDDAAGDAEFGCSVSLSGDRAIVGSEYGSTCLFVRSSSGVWTQVQKLIASDGEADDFFGFSVSISGDIAIVGAYRDDDNGDSSGSAYIYTFRQPSVRNDFDGDRESDLAVLDQSTGRWFARTVGGAQLAYSVNWGWAGVEAVAGDYDGDGVGDLAVFDQNTGRWFIRSLAGAILAWDVNWGWPGVEPVSGDFDGDGIDDLAVFDQNTGRWFIRSVAGDILAWNVYWGWSGVQPVAGDFDGDGSDDLAILDQNTGRWFVRNLGGDILVWEINWGWAGVTGVSGDFDGDAKTDLAVFDVLTGRWFIRTVSGDILAWDVNWGWPSVRPVSGDFDGDGFSDLAIFDEASGRWFVRSLAGEIIGWNINWGWPGVQPVGR